MTITCSGRTWQVHKVVVCSQCPFFAKAVTGRFKEACDSCIDLVDDDPSTVEAMLRWLYYASFEVEESKPPGMSTILFLARSYTIADKYLLADFRITAGQKLRAALMDRDWDVEDLLALIEEIFPEADESFLAAPERLRTWVITATHANYTLCFHSSPSHKRFSEVASSRPDFLSGVMDLSKAQRNQQERNQQKRMLFADDFGRPHYGANRPAPPEYRPGSFWRYY
ncbi:hypothetical protein KC331_g16295 [Hortaea werneckii]|nr:hypothetical protein KC331_g16295 [Hortaea werneckii]KAI7703185.1 hypothetical protein KC353_g14259 [Hortaea werneckii]